MLGRYALITARRLFVWSDNETAIDGLNVQHVVHRPAAGVIFHSDRGSEYMGEPFVTRLTQLGALPSASVRGPGDNAHAESFFHSLKTELIRGTTFLTEPALRAELRRYMQYYNTVRMHSSLDYLSPLAFDQRATETMGVNKSEARSEVPGRRARIARRDPDLRHCYGLKGLKLT